MDNTMIGRVSRVMVAVIACLFACGCSGNEAQGHATTGVDAGSQPAQQVDPRYATAQALLEHAKSLIEESQPNMQAFYELVHTENRDQESWLQYVRYISLPLGEMRAEFRKRFPSDPWPKDLPIWFYEIRIPNARLNTSDDQRAQSQFIEGRQSHVLHLVKKNDRWWISGYTLERARSIDEIRGVATETQQTLDMLLSAAQREHPKIADLTRRLKAGEFRHFNAFITAAEQVFGQP